MFANKLCRLTACALLPALLLPQAAVAAAPVVETDEAVYINLDYYGMPEDTRIVKGVNLNGHTSFTDYGDYSAVYNMSTYDEPALSDGSVTWEIADDGQQRFYYECIPNGEEPIQLPWNFDVSYQLNGVPVEAETCAGASGLIEMTIHAVPNEAASEYYKNNMTLICGTGIDMSKALSIEAPGAQVQSMGTYKIVFFMGLPGEESTFTVRIGSNSFESMGLLLFLAPATLSSLDILADMKDIKDRLGDSGDNLYEGLSSMLETLQSMQSGFNTLSHGVSGINEVRKQLVADRGTLDPKTDAALDALEALAGKSDSLIPELNAMKTILVTFNATVNSMLGTLEESGADILEYQELLRKVKISLDNLEDMFNDLDDAADIDGFYIDQLRSAVDDLKNDMGRLSSNLSSLRNSLSALEDIQDALITLIQLDLAHLVSAGIITPEEAAALGDMLSALPSGLSGTIAASKKTLSTLSDAADSLESMLSSSDGILENLADIADVLDDYEGLPQDFTAEGKKLADLMNTSLERVNQLVADIPALSTCLQQITTEAVSAADKGEELMVALTKALSASYDMLDSANGILRSVRGQADASLQTSIDGLLDVLDKAARSNSSSSLQKATDSIHSAVDDAEKDLEEDTNVLNIDAQAELQSVTSSQNPTPASLQFILRTHEISLDDDEGTAAANQEQADEGVLARIGNIFRKLFSAIYGVFVSEE